MQIESVQETHKRGLMKTSHPR